MWITICAFAIAAGLGLCVVVIAARESRELLGRASRK